MNGLYQKTKTVVTVSALAMVGLVSNAHAALSIDTAAAIADVTTIGTGVVAVGVVAFGIKAAKRMLG